MKMRAQSSWMTELRSDRRMKMLFQGAGAHPWILGRRNGLARGIYNRLKEDDRFSAKRAPAGVQWPLNALISRGGFPDDHMVFGSNPADLYEWEAKDGDLMFAQDTSPSGQFVQQGKLRIMAQEAP